MQTSGNPNRRRKASQSKGRVINGLTKSQRRNLRKKQRNQALRASNLSGTYQVIPQQQLIRNPRPRNRATYVAPISNGKRRFVVAGLEDKCVLDSIHKLHQNLVFPKKGIHRGLALGSAMTAVCTIQGSVIVPIIGATNRIATIGFVPARANNDGVTDPTKAFAAIRIAAAFQDPFQAGSIFLYAPFAQTTQPAASYRPLSFECFWIPTGSLTNQAGDGKLAHTTDINSLAGSYSRFSIDNQVYSYPANGWTSLAYHWIPNIEETSHFQLQSSSTYDDQLSGFVGYFQAAGTNDVMFRLDWTASFEYVPNNVFKPYVQRELADLHPNCFYHFNKNIARNWNPMILGPMSEWEKEQELWDEFTGGFSGIHSVTAVGSTGRGGAPFDLDADSHDSYAPLNLGKTIEEEEEDDNLFGDTSIITKAKKAACATIQDITGQNLCQDPLGGTMKMAFNAMAGTGNFGNPGPKLSIQGQRMSMMDL